MIELPGGPVGGPVGPGAVGLVEATGRLERLLDAAHAAGPAGAPWSRPARVTTILTAALVDQDGVAVDVEWCRRLSVGDRRYLLRQVLVGAGRGAAWHTVVCPKCVKLPPLNV